MPTELRLPGYTIRIKLLLVCGALSVFGILNMAVQEWGARQRGEAFEDVRTGLERRRALVQNMELIKDHFQHVTVLSGVLGMEAVQLSDEDRLTVRRTVDAIPAQLATALGGQNEPGLIGLIDEVNRLAASWRAFHENQEIDPPAAVAELVLRADPLAQALLTSSFPSAIELEDRKVSEATARFMLADRAGSFYGWMIFLFTAGIAAFLVWLTARDIGRGVTMLKEGARRIGGGDLDSRIRLAAPDELGAVARAFNHMAAGLQTTQRQLQERNQELDRMLQELRHTQQELVQTEKLSAMGGMLAGLAHELNNPLASVLGYAELLELRLSEIEGGEIGEIRTDLAEPIVAEAIRARELVRDMLAFSRKPSALAGSVSIRESLRLVSSLRSFAFAQAAITLDIDQEEELWVHAESQRLQQIFVNLANNTLDALANGGGSRLLIRASAVDDRTVVILFADDGPGLNDPDRVFDPFYTTKPVGSGTGLGLTLVHRFVTEFGGTITAANGHDGGARFEIRLLRVEPATTSDEASAVKPKQESSVYRTSPAATLNGTKRKELSADRRSPGEDSERCPEGECFHVLVVEDEDPIRNLHLRLLNRMGVRVTAVANGSDAREVLREVPVDLVISDVKMPGELNGLALFEWTRQACPELSDRFLFVTGDVHDPGLASFIRDYPERFLTKPFQLHEYSDRVGRALHGGVPVS